MLPWHYRCSTTGATYDASQSLYLSPADGHNTPAGGCLRGVLEIVYDFDASGASELKQKICGSGCRGTGRYAALTPLRRPHESLPAMEAGGTPLISSGRYGQRHGFKKLLFKNDTLNPTGSYKDRASEIVVARAREAGISRICCASTGNAATALAGMCANTGVEAIVFVPASAPQGKLAQILAYGAQVVRVDGTYDQACALSAEATARFGWYNRNTAFNPFTIDGKRSCSFEIAEQLGWRSPDVVAVASGDGVIMSGIAKGFHDLHAAGLINRVPRILCVQAEGSNSIVRAWREGLDIPPTLRGASSMADSIVVEAPANGIMSVRDIKQSNGVAIDVTEDEIRNALFEVASKTGIYIEASCSAAAAGVVKAADSGLISRDDEIVCVLTGSGLKDTAGTLKCVQSPEAMPANLDEITKRMKW